jgi:hypothetical protein
MCNICFEAVPMGYVSKRDAWLCFHEQRSKLKRVYVKTPRKGSANMTHTKESGKSTITGLVHDPEGRRTLTLSNSVQGFWVRSWPRNENGDLLSPVQWENYRTTWRHD